MATYAQRFQAIGDALLNSTATLAQLDRLGTALAKQGAREAEYAAATNAGKAQIAMEELRRRIIATVKDAEASAAVEQAKIDAANAVDDSFAEPT